MEFSSQEIVVYSTKASADSVAIQLYVRLPDGASRPEDAATTQVLPLPTLQQVFDDDGDIIMGYTLSSSLAAAVAGSSDQSKWKHLFFGGGTAVIIFGFILTVFLCFIYAVYKWKQKKRQVGFWYLNN